MSEQELDELEKDRLEDLLEKDRSELSDSEVTSLIKLSIRKSFDSPEWMLFFEVPANEASEKSYGHKRADAIAINSYPGRNFRVVGLEFKASRSDWKRELNDGAKSDYFVRQCDDWYVVTGRSDIIKDGELPEGWGWLNLTETERIYKRQESNLSDHQDASLSKEFYIRMMKKAYESAKWDDKDIRMAQRKGAKKQERDNSKVEKDFQYKQMKERSEKFLEFKKMFKEKVNENPYGFSSSEMEKIAKAYDFIEKVDEDGVYTIEGRLDSMKNSLESVADEVGEAEDMLNKVRSIVEDEES